MAIKFDAHEVSVTEEFDVLVIALAGAPDCEDEFYLMVQYKDSYTDQDVQFGLAGPHIELCDQGWSWYGHIERFELSRDRIQVKMDSSAASEMKNDGEFDVRFELDDRKFTDLRTALERTFHGKTYFHENF